MLGFKVIDKRDIKAIFLTKGEFKLLQDWLGENLTCIPCMERSIARGWKEAEIKRVEKLFRENFNL